MSFRPQNQAYSVANGISPTYAYIPQTRDPGPTDVGPPYQLYQPWVNTITKGIWYLEALLTSNGVVTAQWRAVGPIVVASSGPAAPLTSSPDYAYPIGQTWCDSVANDYYVMVSNPTATTGYWIKLSAGTQGIDTLSDDVGTLVFPTANGNIQLVGHVPEDGGTKFSTTVAGTNLITINPMSTARWIVDPFGASGINGTHTTIASALTSSFAGDTIFILPGIYLEDLTLKNGVNLVAYNADALTPNVTISGKLTANFEGSCSISGIRLQTASDFFLEVSGSSETIINLFNCYLNCLNNTGINFTSSDPASEINISSCQGNLGATGITYWVSTSDGSININSCGLGNSGASSTASSNSESSVTLLATSLGCPLSTSSTGTLVLYNSVIDSSATNTTTITTAGSGTSVIYNCTISSGSASSISVGAGTTVGLDNSSVVSSNTNAITGSGTISYGTVDFVGASKLINTTTQSNVNSSTFTPTLAFGGASVGITYTTQVGRYYRSGNTVFISIDITTSSKGTSVGALSITGLPFASAYTNVDVPFFFYTGSVAVAASTGFIADLSLGSTTLNLYSELAATSNLTALTDANCANATTIRICMSYFI